MQNDNREPFESMPLAELDGEPPPRPKWFADAIAQQPERRWHEVQGAQIETLVWGRAGASGLVLLHGKMAHADWWSFIAPFFAATHRVLAISFSGMGGSDWRDAYSAAQMADEVMAAARAEGLLDGGRKPVVLGHSFGAFVSLHLAARHGHELAGVVTLDMPLMSREQRAARRSVSLRDGFSPRPTRLYRDVAQAIARFRFQPPQPCANLYIADHIARTSLREVEDDEGRSGFTWRFDPRVAPLGPGDVLALVKEAACPLAAAWGADSELVTPEVAAYVASLMPAGAPQIEIAGAHHHVMVDQPLALIEAMRELLAHWPAQTAATANPD